MNSFTFEQTKSMKTQKELLRKSVQQIVKQKTTANIQIASKRIAENVDSLNLGPKNGNKCVSIYLSMPHEVNTSPILSRLFSENCRVFIPKVVGLGHHDMRMPELHNLSELSSLQMNKWKIPEFTNRHLAEREDGLNGLENAIVDTVIIPGVAFTVDCHRLGHGKGYYDHFLSTLLSRRKSLGLPSPLMIGIAFDEQIVDSIPSDDHDVVLDIVVTPKSIFRSTA